MRGPIKRTAGSRATGSRGPGSRSAGERSAGPKSPNQRTTGQRSTSRRGTEENTSPRSRRSSTDSKSRESAPPNTRPEPAARRPVPAPVVVSANPERLQKVLADAGFGSRREIERWIEQGRVAVDGEVATLGLKVLPTARILLDGKPVAAVPKLTRSRVLLLNKSAGTISTRNDPEGRPTVFEDLPDIRRGRWVMVGRLDTMTSGLLLFTDDGELANKLMHPSSVLDREYAVRIDGTLTDAEITMLCEGVTIEGEAMRFTDLRYYDGRSRNHWYHAVLMEGKQHEVRLLFTAVGRVVSRLKRVRFGPVALPSRLLAGHYEELPERDVAQLRRLVGLSNPPTTANVREDRKKSVLLPFPELSERHRGS